MSLQRLGALAQSVQGSGERFFDQMVEQLVALLGVRRAEVLQIADRDPSCMQAVAVWDGGLQTPPDMVQMHPYLEVLDNHQIVIERDVQRACPDNPQLAALGAVGFVGTPLIGSTGRVLGCLALLNDAPLDMSRQPELVAQLFAPLAAGELERRQSMGASPEQNSVQDDVLAALSHEVRDQLSGIVNAADVLRQTAGSDPQARWATQIMDRQLHYMVGLMDDLGTVSELAQGTLELHFEYLDLDLVVRRAIEVVEPELSLRRQDLTLETTLGPVPVLGDPDRLLQVMTRLLDSASRGTSFGGRIVLSVRSAGGQAEVRLAEPQTALGPAAGPLPNRPRVGLILVRRLIELHGGTLAITGGSTPEILLRLPSTAMSSLHPPGPARRILVVDDDLDAAMSLGRALEKRGHQVRVAHSGKEALEVLPDFRPDAVFLDIGLPGLDGLDVARRIRALPEQQDLTLVAATGRGWSEDRQRSLQAGFDHHLVKPLSLEDIETVLAQGRNSGARPAARLT